MTKNEKTIRKIINIIDDIFTYIVRIFMLILIICGIYIAIDSTRVFYNASSNKIALYKPEIITEQTLKEINGNCVAWIEINDTTINFPIMQGIDNMEYINKNPYGEYSLSGSIFLDAKNTFDFSDDYSIVYGHYMKDGYMFGALDYFEDNTYFNEHRYGTLSVGNINYNFQTVAFLHCQATDNEIFSTDDNINNRIEFIKKNAIIIDNSINLSNYHLVALTTCSGSSYMGRTILIGIITNN